MFLPNVSYVIEFICFKEISVIFFILSIPYIISVNFCVFSLKTGQTFFPVEDILILLRIFLTEGFLAFGTTSFHTKFYDFCA